MKYQVILESNEIIPDDEFALMINMPVGHGFKILEARSLEGIRKEVYEKCDKLASQVNHMYGPSLGTIIETFEDISDLFKIKE